MSQARRGNMRRKNSHIEKLANPEEDDDLRKHERATKFINSLYDMSGGIYQSARFSKTVKLVWFLFNGIIIVNIFSVIVYMVNNWLKGATIWDALLEYTLIILFMVCNVIVSPCILVCHHVDVITAIEYATDIENLSTDLLCDNFFARKGNKNPSSRADSEVRVLEKQHTCNNRRIRDTTYLNYRDPYNLPMKFYCCLVVLCLLYFFLPMFYVAFFLDEIPYLTNHYAQATPFYDRIPSMKVYYLLNFVQLMINTPYTMSSMAQIVFFFSFAGLMNNIMFKKCKKMQRLGWLVTEYFERQVYAFDEQNEQRINQNEFYLHFENELIKLVNEFQKFTRTVNLIRPFINYTLSLFVYAVSMVQFINTFYLLMPGMGPFDKIRHLSLCGASIAYLYCICYFAKMFDDMNDAILFEVYNLPWYYLRPKTRKYINIFQNMVSNPWEFRILIYPLSMATFPRIMSSIYTYFNCFRTMRNG